MALRSIAPLVKIWTHTSAAKRATQPARRRWVRCRAALEWSIFVVESREYEVVEAEWRVFVCSCWAAWSRVSRRSIVRGSEVSRGSPRRQGGRRYPNIFRASIPVNSSISMSFPSPSSPSCPDNHSPSPNPKASPSPSHPLTTLAPKFCNALHCSCSISASSK